MAVAGPGMAPVGDGVAGPVICGQQQLAALGVEGLAGGPADGAVGLAVALPRVRVDVVERKDLDGMTQSLLGGELFRGRVLGHGLVEFLALILAFLLIVFFNHVEELGWARGGLDRVVRLAFVVVVPHDRLGQDEEEGVAWGGGHPCVGDRVVEPVVGAHAPEKGLSSILLQVVRRQRSRLCV